MVDVFHRLRSVDDVPFALETTFLPADLTGASSTNRTTGGYRRCSGTATASTWPARPRYWNPSSSTMRPARRSACGRIGGHSARPPHWGRRGAMCGIRPRRLPCWSRVVRGFRTPRVSPTLTGLSAHWRCR